MKRSSHYSILGIPRGESPEGIRAAYLRLVKALHPDRAGAPSTRAFREVQQAYDVLSDPVSRRSYDEKLGRKRPVRTWRAEPLTRHQPIEPLVPDERLATTAGVNRRPAQGDWPGSFFAGAAPIAANPWQSTRYDLDLKVSPEQAALGGDFTIAVPIEVHCPFCSGTGLDWPSPCLACHQQGTIVREHVLRLHIPAGAQHGSFIHVQPEQVDGIALRVRLLTDRTTRAPPLW